MAIAWGGYESSGGNGMRVGIDVNTEDIGHGDAGCTFTVKYYTQNIHTWSDTQTLNLGGSIGGSINYGNNSGEGVIYRGTRNYVYDYAWNEYGATGKSRTFSATVNGAYNGITPSKSVTVNVPGRPIAGPAAPGGADLKRINDESNLVTWNNHPTAGEPYGGVQVQRSVNGANFVTIANLGGAAEKYTDSGAIPNRYWQYRVRAENSVNFSGFDTTDTIWTSPATPTACARTEVGTDQKVTWNNNVGYPQHAHHIWVSVNGGAFAYLDWVGSGAETYTHNASSPGGAPVPTNKYQYKVRAKTTLGYDLYSSFSGVTTQSGGTTTPPDPPTDLAPAGDLVKDPTQPIVLTWQHNPTDGSAQTDWQIQYRVAGGAWTTITTTVPTVLTAAQKQQSMYTLDPGTFSYSQEIEWQVATAGSDPALSAWSEIAGFDTQSLTPIKYPIYLDLASGRMEALSSGAPSGGGSAVPAHMHVTRTAGAHTLQSGVFEAFAFEGTNCVISESGLAISFTPGGSTPPGGFFTIHETGVYDCSAQYTVAPNAAGRRILCLRINGALHTQMETPPAPGAAAGTVGPTLGTTAHLNEGDQVWFEMWQNCGSNLAVTVRSDIYWGRITKIDAAQGPAGPPGPAGGAYTHTQGTPVASWVINHPLPYRPSVTVVDSTGRQVEGDVVYTDADTVTVGFSGAFSGVAYLS